MNALPVNQCPLPESTITSLMLEFLTIHTESKETRRAYTSDLEELGRFTRGNLTDESLMRYKRHLDDSRAPRSANRMLSTARKFIYFLMDKQLMTRNYYGHIKGKKIDRYDSPYEALSDAEVKAMLDHSRAIKGYTGSCMHLAITLCFYLGLRRSEVVALRYSDLTNGTLRVKGKGGKVRRIPLPETLLLDIDKHTVAALGYLGELSPGQLIFSSKRSDAKGVNSNTLYRWFVAVAHEVGITKHISPHSARATCITKGLDQGVSIRDMSILAGHSSIETTSIYDKRRGEASMRAVSAIKY